MGLLDFLWGEAQRSADGHAERATINRVGRYSESRGGPYGRETEHDLGSVLFGTRSARSINRERAQAAGAWHWWHVFSPPRDGHWYPDRGPTARRLDAQRQAERAARTSDPMKDYHVEEYSILWGRRRRR
jgi:hypothetical protein